MFGVSTEPKVGPNVSILLTLQSAIHPNNRRICEPHVTRIVGLLYPRKLSANCADILLERASS